MRFWRWLFPSLFELSDALKAQEQATQKLRDAYGIKHD